MKDNWNSTYVITQAYASNPWHKVMPDTKIRNFLIGKALIKDCALYIKDYINNCPPQKLWLCRHEIPTCSRIQHGGGVINNYANIHLASLRYSHCGGITR